MSNQPNQPINAELVTKSENKELSPKRSDESFWLTEAEKFALDYFKGNLCKGGASSYPLAPSVQAQLFTLYLNGRTLEEIRKLNHPAYSLGQIVHAAVVGDWYNQKIDYQNNLLNTAKERLQQIGCESVNFLADSLAAAHKQHGLALQKYLQTGNEADLGAFAIGGIRQYKEVAEMLLKLTGQDKNTTSTLNVKGVVQHIAAEAAVANTSARPSLAELASKKKNEEREALKKNGKAEE